MNPSIYNPCEDGIAAKVWELLRRNKAFQEKTRELKSFRGNGGEWKKFMFTLNENNPFAYVAWNWMHEPIIIPCKLEPQRGQRKLMGPRIGKDQFFNEYEEDKRKGRAPLRLDSTWPDTPRGFQNNYRAKWADYTDVREIVPSEFYPNKDEIPTGIEIAPDLPADETRPKAGNVKIYAETAHHWHWAVKDNRVFAIPRVSIRGKSSREKIIEFISEKLEEDSPPPKVQLFGTEAQWKSFLAIEYFLKSDSLSRGMAIEKAIVELGYGRDLDPVIRRNRYYSRIQGQADAIDNSNEDFPDQNGWIQLIYPKVYPITELKKIVLERADSPVRQ